MSAAVTLISNIRNSFFRGVRPVRRYLALADVRMRIETSLYHDAVASLEPASAVSLPVSATVATAVDAMKKGRIGSILVIDGGGKLNGIFTERDLLSRVAAEEVDPRESTISEMMTRAPETVKPDNSLAHAFHRMMVSDLRYLPLVDDEGRSISIETSRDLINFLSACIES